MQTDPQVLNLIKKYGGVDNLIQVLQRLNLNQQVQPHLDGDEIFIDIWRGDSFDKRVSAFLGKTNRNNYYLLTGSQTSTEESDANTLSLSVINILRDLRLNNPPQLNVSHILGRDFLILTGNPVKAWKVVLGTTTGAHRWDRQVAHIRIGTPIQ